MPTSGVTLNLVVIRSRDIELAVSFYDCLGLQFSKHRHGNGPEHYTAELSGSIFEIYPHSEKSASTLGVRIGFNVPSVKDSILALEGYPNSVEVPATDSEWGLRAVVIDPDGHKIELLQR